MAGREQDHYELGYRIQKLQELQQRIRSSRLPEPSTPAQAQRLIAQFYSVQIPAYSAKLVREQQQLSAARRIHAQARNLTQIAEEEFRGSSLVSGIWEAGEFGCQRAVKLVYFDPAHTQYFFRAQTSTATPESVLRENNTQLEEQYGIKVRVPTKPSKL